MSHAILSPSAATRWLHCPASAVMSLVSPERECGEAAKRGTELHKQAEGILRFAIAAGDMPILPDPSDDPSIAMLKYCETVGSFILRGCKVELEKRVRLSELCFGTADAIIVDEDFGELIVVDLKTGASPVAPSSVQVGIYAAAAAKDYPGMAVTTIICQGNTEERHSWPAEDLAAIEAKVLDVQQQVFDFFNMLKEMRFAPSDTACRWCPASGGCISERQSMFDGEGMDKVIVEGKWAADPNMMSPEDIETVLRHSAKVKKWLDAVEAYALDKVMQGGAIPGFKIGTKRNGRRWRNEREVLEALLQRGFTREQLMPGKFISPAQAGKLGVPDEILEEYIEVVQGKPSLVADVDSSSEDLF